MTIQEFNDAYRIESDVRSYQSVAITPNGTVEYGPLDEVTETVKYLLINRETRNLDRVYEVHSEEDLLQCLRDDFQLTFSFHK